MKELSHHGNPENHDGIILLRKEGIIDIRNLSVYNAGQFTGHRIYKGVNR